MGRCRDKQHLNRCRCKSSWLSCLPQWRRYLSIKDDRGTLCKSSSIHDIMNIHCSFASSVSMMEVLAKTALFSNFHRVPARFNQLPKGLKVSGGLVVGQILHAKAPTILQQLFTRPNPLSTKKQEMNDQHEEGRRRASARSSLGIWYLLTLFLCRQGFPLSDCELSTSNFRSSRHFFSLSAAGRIRCMRQIE